VEQVVAPQTFRQRDVGEYGKAVIGKLISMFIKAIY
jgi:hypothetical protein